MLARFSLRNTLLGGFASVLVAFVLLSLYLLQGLASVKADLVDMHDSSLAFVEQSLAIAVLLGDLDGEFSRSIYSDDLAIRTAALEAFGEVEVTTLAALDELGSEPLDDAERVAYDDLVRTFSLAQATWADAHALLAAGDLDAARAADVAAVDAWGVAAGSAHDLVDIIEHDAEERYLSALSDANRRRTLSLTAAGLLSVLIAVGSWLLAGSISRRVSQSADQLNTSSEDLAAVASQVGAAAEETATQANVVAAAGEQVSHNVQTVATAVEEMSASVREIATSSSDASKVAAEAVRSVEVTNENVAKLGESSAQIGKVIEVITSIAEQTNLLALNAT
ncbi:methyl-accepting chemotaxis protein, partial [Nitriliruptor alkaliphilus]|uniref:methyl-accepting chemotaxis protein n=1 Tax=Nitriliruptor alkaliphilus TaxID=427918 RepID=UPI001FE21A66